MRRWVTAAVVGLTVAAGVLLPAPVFPHKPITTNILFKNEVAQIFQRKCFQCHSDNNIAMSLTTYTDARPWARAIREEILDREMPPWQAVQGYGHFANDISLNTREKEIILSWTDGGAPSGVLKAEESIPPVYVPPAPSWDHGEPDLVLPVSSGHAVAAGAPFAVQRFVIDTKLAQPRRVRAIALKQGDRRLVRHAAFYSESSGQWIGGWTPWQTLSTFTGGVAVRLPANARLAVEIGYAGTSEDATDSSEIGLYFAEGAGPDADAIKLTGPQSSLDAGATAHRVRTDTSLAADTRVLAFWPSPGTGARSVEISAVRPDGMVAPMLWINAYRAEWRSPYLLASPVDLPRGSRVVMTTYYHNATDRAVAVQPQAWMITAKASPQASARQK
jgi:hypothetical protein